MYNIISVLIKRHVILPLHCPSLSKIIYLFTLGTYLDKLLFTYTSILDHAEDTDVPSKYEYVANYKIRSNYFKLKISPRVLLKNSCEDNHFLKNFVHRI